MSMTNELICFYRNYISDKIDRPFKSESVLTSREIVVVILAIEGLTNGEIAAKLYISIKTVKNHMSNIYNKLNVSSRVNMVVYALENDITKLLEV